MNNFNHKSGILTLAILVLTVLVTNLAYAIDSKQIDLNQLRNWSIKTVYKPIGKLGGSAPSTHALDYRYSYRPNDPQKPYFVYLNRIGDSKKVVAVFQLKPEMKLNPRKFFKKQGFDYGPIPEINNFTKQQANCLWGRGYRNTAIQDCLTYNLKTKNQNFGEDVFIDVIFKNNCISQYKIRNTKLDSINWIGKNEGGWILPILLLMAVTAVVTLLLPKRLAI